jgi:hypothetical protein
MKIAQVRRAGEGNGPILPEYFLQIQAHRLLQLIPAASPAGCGGTYFCISPIIIEDSFPFVKWFSSIRYRIFACKYRISCIEFVQKAGPASEDREEQRKWSRDTASNSPL